MRQKDMLSQEFLSSCCCLVVLSNVTASTTSRTFSLYFSLVFEQIDLYTFVHASYNPRRIRLLSKSLVISSVYALEGSFQNYDEFLLECVANWKTTGDHPMIAV
jgi:hypothetical protein